MSIRLMSAAWDVALADSDKLVLLALADWANDSGECWPSVPQLSKKCSKSQRTIQGALRHLEKDGHIERQQIPGRGCRYIIHPRKDCTPAAAAPRSDCAPAETAPTPAAAAPNTLIKHHITSEAKASSVSRPKRERALSHALPANFEPILTADAQRIVDCWPPGMFERELAQWKDHHTAKGTLAKDWQASLRTWLRNAEKWNPTNGRLPNRPDAIRGSGADASGADLLKELRSRREARRH